MTLRACRFGIHSFVQMFRALVAASLLLGAGMASAAITYSWTGTGGNNLWSNPNNWNPSGVPAPGDALAFPAGVSNLSTNNDLTGAVVTGLFLNGSNYTLAGNPIMV